MWPWSPIVDLTETVHVFAMQPVSYIDIKPYKPVHTQYTIYMYCMYLGNILSTNEMVFLLLFSSQPSWSHHGGISDCGVHQLYLALSRGHGL